VASAKAEKEERKPGLNLHELGIKLKEIPSNFFE